MKKVEPKKAPNQECEKPLLAVDYLEAEVNEWSARCSTTPHLLAPSSNGTTNRCKHQFAAPLLPPGHLVLMLPVLL